MRTDDGKHPATVNFQQKACYPMVIRESMRAAASRCCNFEVLLAILEYDRLER
jgi:hypothetical protein